MLRWIVQASTAVFGLALGIAAAARIRIPARPGDLVSALQSSGHHPREVVFQFLLAVALTALFAFLGDRIARLLVPHRWAAIGYSAILLLSPVTLMYYGNLRHVLLMGVGAAVVVALRKRDPRFSAGDAVLVPTVLACYMAFLDLGFGGTPVATFFRALLAVFLVRILVGSSDAWVASPLAFLAVLGWLPLKVGGVLALVIIFVTPLVLARTKLRVPRAVVYPILAFIYPLAVLTVPLNGFAVNFFEDSHEIPHAVEMMRGEKPYTDVIPQHGLVSDGGLHYLAMQTGVRSLRTLLNVRLVAGVATTVAIYCLALAATGSLELAMLSMLLTVFLFPHSTVFFRPSAAIFALAAIVAATRLRSRHWFAIAGALVVIAFLFSIDFGMYSAFVAFFAVIRARAWKPFFIGVVAAAIPVLLLFAVFGFAIDFIRVTVSEVLGGHDVYFQKVLEIPECLRTPALLHVLPQCFSHIVWIVALVASAVALARSPLRAKRSDAAWLIGLWIVLAGASFISRGNLYFNAVVMPFLAAALWRMSRHARTLAIVLAVAVVLIAEPLKHVISFIPAMRAAGPTPLFDPATNESVEAAKRFVATLPPGETFLDFANSALLYPLTKRDLPLRQVEVAQYESEERQRELIARLEQDRRISAALIAFRPSDQAIDGIPNAARAPQVWAYLQQHFTPAFDEAGVVFWRRAR